MVSSYGYGFGRIATSLCVEVASLATVTAVTKKTIMNDYITCLCVFFVKRVDRLTQGHAGEAITLPHKWERVKSSVSIYLIIDPHTEMFN